MDGNLTRIMRGSSAELLVRIMRVLFPDAKTVLDVTYGNGKFWTTDAWASGPPVVLTGTDLDPERARDRVADFTLLPFSRESYDVVVFDPPYQTDSGRSALIGNRFGSYPTVDALRAAVEAGTSEAWRVCRIGIVVKIQDYIHASRLVRMSRWVEEAVPADLYDVVYLESPSKVEDGKWGRVGGQLSVRSNATTWLIFRKDGPVHRRR